jgi:hypothetical protein
LLILAECTPTLTSMSRINDLPGPIAAQSGDTVVGTDKTDSNKTVKFTVDSIAALATGSSVALLDDIGNVNTSSKSDGQVLSWNESEGEWRATTVSGSGATALPDLTDVADDATSSASPGDVLAWDTSSGGEWQSQATSLVIAPETLNSLDDVNLTTVVSGNFLKYNGSNWENTLPVISDIDDVDVSVASAGDILVLAAGEWTATAPLLSTLGNVSSAADAPGAGHLLYNNGTQWIASNNTITVTLSPAAGQTVQDAITAGVGIPIGAPTADMLIGDAFMVPTELNEWSITRISVAAFHPDAGDTYDVRLARAAAAGSPAFIGAGALTMPTATANTYSTVSQSASPAIEVTTGDVISFSVIQAGAVVSGGAKQLTVTIEFTQNP